VQNFRKWNLPSVFIWRNLTIAVRLASHVRVVGYLLLASFAASWAPSRACGESIGASDSGIPRPPYAQVLARLSQVATASQGWVTSFEYGRSVLGRPLRIVKIQDPSRVEQEAVHPTVLISGATHGSEYLGIEDRLPEWFFQSRFRERQLNQFFAAGGVLLIVPIVNPDGFVAGTRLNAHGVDLNRDFDLVPTNEGHFAEPETRDLADWLAAEIADNHLQLRLTVDYHCCDGSLLFPWSYSDAGLPAADLEAHEQVGRLMQSDIDSSYNFGSTGKVLGYLARGTSKDYYFARYHALAFTFEGLAREELAKFPSHTRWWTHVIGLMTAQPTSH